MFAYGAAVALLLGAGHAVRVSDVQIGAQPAENLADHKAGKEFFPEKDENILRRIRSVSPYAGTPELLPALMPLYDEKVCGYRFTIDERRHGFQTWVLTGMRVTRHVFDECQDVKLEKRIPIAFAEWVKESGKKKMMKVMRASKERPVLFTIQQERKGQHLFRILPPGTDDPAATLFQFKTSANELYSGSRQKDHKWEVYRGDQREQEEVAVDCMLKGCSFEKHVGDKMKYMGETEQSLESDPDALVTKEWDVNYLDTHVEVAADNDSGLVLAVASVMVHKFKVQPTGILASTIMG